MIWFGHVKLTVDFVARNYIGKRWTEQKAKFVEDEAWTRARNARANMTVRRCVFGDEDHGSLVRNLK